MIQLHPFGSNQIKKYLAVFLVFISGWAIGQTNELRKLNYNERLLYAFNDKFPGPNTIYSDSTGKTYFADILFDPAYSVDYFVDQSGNIVKGIIRPANSMDRQLMKKMIDTLESKNMKINSFQIDCSKMREVLSNAFSVDQSLRANGMPDLTKDRENQYRVISLIEKCGFPSKEEVGEEGITTIFLIVQHGTRKMREKYFPLLKSILAPKDVALMEDRILLENGEKQLYGTQVIYNNRTNKYEVRAIKDPLKINDRRREVGLGSIEEYLKKWNIEYISK